MRLAIPLLAFVLFARRANAETGERWDGKTVAVQSATGAATMALGTTLFTLCVLTNFGDGNPSQSCGIGSAIALGITTLVATTASVQLAGDALDGTGSVVGTSLGMAIGLGVGIVSGTAVARFTTHDVPIVAAALIPIVAGAVLGYQLSADDPVDRTIRVPLLSGAF